MKFLHAASFPTPGNTPFDFHSLRKCKGTFLRLAKVGFHSLRK
jgi:hypothetical protein